MDIKQFGSEIIEKLLEGEDESIKILRQQFKDSKIKKVEFTGPGFFIYFSINPKNETLNKKNLEIGCICKINNTNDIYDISLFIREGVIDFLEGVIFGDGEFPKKIDSYEFKISSNDIKKIKNKI